MLELPNFGHMTKFRTNLALDLDESDLFLYVSTKLKATYDCLRFSGGNID